MQERKVFTFEEAKNALVLVEPIVKDIVRKRKEMVRLKALERNGREEGRQKTIQNLAKEITYHLEELKSIGCQLKDFNSGKVMFPSKHKDKVTSFSWTLGEEGVTVHYESKLVHYAIRFIPPNIKR